MVKKFLFFGVSPEFKLTTFGVVKNEGVEL